MKLNLHKILILRLSLPILIPILALGGFLYFFVLNTIDDFARERIQHDLAFHTRRAYNICNINFDQLLLSGLADDPDELTIKQALTLGQIEDFFNQESLKGIIYDRTQKKNIFQTSIPEQAISILKFELKNQEPILFESLHEKYYAYLNEFSPWNWQILVIKNVNAYSYLIKKVQKVQLLTLGSLICITFLMLFFIHHSINRPTRAIIRKVQNKEKPNYKGIDVFEFLSDTISRMMTSLQQSEEKYRMLVENSSHMIWEIDLKRQFTFVSPTIYDILGYHPNELIGKDPFSFMPKEDAVSIQHLYQTFMDNHSPIDAFITTYVHKSGQTIILETTGRPFFDEHHLCLGYRGVSREITERFRAEKAKIQAQKIAAEQAQHALVGQVAGKMAHDFNNILGIIMGNSELALLDSKEEETRQVLQIILDQTKRGKNLTKNLVAFAKDQEPKQEFFNINQIIDLVLTLMKKDLNQIHVETHFDQTIPELLADPGMIEHTLVNLIQNSIHALSLVHDPRIDITTAFFDQQISIEITDNGCGIPDAHLEDIFSPSFTLKGSKDVTGSYQKGIKGTGYGMSNIKKYIQQHKGTIEIKSELGKYTTVRIKLPVIERELTKAEKETISNGFLHIRKNILLVEDEQTISQVQSRVLSQAPCHHHVDLAENGKEALKMFQQGSYDLISLDYILPGMMNGRDVYEQIRKIDPRIPILFVSGNIEFLESIKELKKNDDCIDHLSKPCQNAEYIEAVNMLLTNVLNASNRSDV